MKSENYLAFKAVSVHEDGKVYSLGMGPAKVIHLPVGTWIKSKEGISAGMTASHAKKVIYYANRRKTLPIPPDMRVVKVLGRGIKFRSSWRVIFKKIMIIPAEQGRAVVEVKPLTLDRKIELIKDILLTYNREVEGYYYTSERDPLEKARGALRSIDDVIRREY